LVKFALSAGGVLSFTQSFGVNPKLTNMKFGLETSLYRAVQYVFRYLEPFSLGSQV